MRDRILRLSPLVRRHSTFLQFAAVGLTGLAVDQSMLFVLTLWLPAEVARVGAIWISLSWTFFGNRWLTFAARRGDNPLGQYFRFCGGCSVGSAVNWATSVGVWSLFPEIWGVHSAGALIGSLAGLGFNFTLSSRWVFRSQPAESSDQAVRFEMPGERKKAA